METSEAWLSNKSKSRLNVRLRSVADTYYALFYADGNGVGIVGPNNGMLLLLDNDSTINIYPTEVQAYEISSSSSIYYKNHQYKLSSSDLHALSSHKLKSIRVHTSEGYFDYEIKDKLQDQFRQLSILFLKNL